MKLTFDFDILPQYIASPNGSALAYLLSKGSKGWLSQSLEEYVCHESGIRSQLDYPLAAIAASADGLEVGADFWLRADPVHMLMHRDCFSLAEPVPLPLDTSHARALMASLNAHFQQTQNMTFIQGVSGACYLRLRDKPQFKTVVPGVAVGKNAFHFIPQGDASAYWRAYLNEVQMLLHTHPVNVERESVGLPAINNIWFSGGGVLPQKGHDVTDVSLVVAKNPLYSGLAQWLGVPYMDISDRMEDVLSHNVEHTHVRLHGLPDFVADGACFEVLIDAIRNNVIRQLVMNVGYYERTLVVTVSRLDLFKFWRKVKSMPEIFS